MVLVRPRLRWVQDEAIRKAVLDLIRSRSAGCGTRVLVSDRRPGNDDHLLPDSPYCRTRSSRAHRLVTTTILGAVAVRPVVEFTCRDLACAEVLAEMEVLEIVRVIDARNIREER